MILKFIRNLVACSINHYPGVSHRKFGFQTNLNERHEFDTVHEAIEPNRTNKTYSNWQESNALNSNEFDWVRSFNEVELFTKTHEWDKIVQLIQRWNSQGDLIEVLVPFTVFPYSDLTLNTDYFLWKVYQGKILTLQVWKPKSSWTMTVRFCSRYPLGHRTHKNTHMKKVLCSPLPFACMHSSSKMGTRWNKTKPGDASGVSHRTVGFPALSNERHWTKWNSLQKITNGTKSFNWSIVETAKAICRFGSFYCCISLFWVNSRYCEKCTKEKYQLFKSGSLNHLELWLFHFLVDFLSDIELTSTHTLEKSSVFAFVGWLHWTLPFEKV